MSLKLVGRSGGQSAIYDVYSVRYGKKSRVNVALWNNFFV